MKRVSLLCLVAAVGVLGVRASAHHSQAAVYKAGEKVTIEGELVQVLIRSPHSFVHVLAKDENGEMQRYAVEWSGAAQLRRSGINAQTLKVGDQVVVEGTPGRNPVDRRMLLVTLTRPSDGFVWGRQPGEVVD
jgi:lysyl-tRNA synthetase class II